VTVSPDGATEYYARATGGRCSNGDPITEIVSVSITGTVAKSIAANVHYPEVSPDGRHLAFTGLPGCSDAGSAVLMLDLRAPSAAPRPSPPQMGLGGEPGIVIWDQQSRVGTRQPPSPGRVARYRARHPRPRHPNASVARRVPRLELRDTNRRWNTICCYLSNNKFVGSSVEHDRSTVWTFDATGARQNRLTCCGTVFSTDRL
jgi:hypothetical protein